MSEVTQKIKIYCMDLIKAQVNSAIDAAPDYMTTLADNAAHPHDRTLYLDTMHDIGFQRRKLFQSFIIAMEPGFNDLISTTNLTSKKRQGGIDTSHVVGLSELEEKLALEIMINTSKSRSDLAMQSIIRSLNGLMGDDWTKFHQNPLDTEILVLAWLKAVKMMQLPIKGNLAMYGLFDSHVLNLLPLMYEKIGHYMADILSHRNSSSNISMKQTKDNSLDNSLDEFESAFDDIDSPASMPDFVQSDRRFGQNDSRTDDTKNQQSTFEGDPVPERRTEELVSLLDRLQRNRDLDDNEFYDGNHLIDYRALLLANHAVPESEINPWTIGQINDDVIDMTGLLFSFIMEDAHLPEDIRYHISRLQIPYLKLGFQDKSIFVDKMHPARQLLNDLAESISLWDPRHTGGLDMLLSKTVSVVDNILNDYNMDTQIFAELQKDFSSFLAGDTHIDDDMQQRQKQAASKTETADNAKLLVESMLLEICKDKRIPPVIEQILEEFWSKVLFLEYLKSGDESEDFKDFIKTVEILVDSVQAKYAADDRKAMAKQLPGLIQRLKEGFSTISVAAFETVGIFRELQECHMLVLKERPELEDEVALEVPDDEYEAFKSDQSVITQWNRADLESALLEESIERSLNRSDTDAHAFDDNQNILTGKHDLVRDATMVKAAREREIIDNELKEARDAYEQALKEHNEQKKASSPKNDNNDFMTQFFQDPEFIQKQYEGNRDLSADTDVHLENDNSDSVDELTTDFGEEVSGNDNVFDQMLAEHLSTTPDIHEDNKVEIDDKQSSHKVTLINESKTDFPLEDEQFTELSDEEVADRQSRLKVGLWVDLYQHEGVSVRAKIMAIVPSVGKYIFGDRSGKKLADYDIDSLAIALRKGEIRVSEQDTVFDKTLESVIANLRVMKKAEDD